MRRSHVFLVPVLIFLSLITLAITPAGATSEDECKLAERLSSVASSDTEDENDGEAEEEGGRASPLRRWKPRVLPSAATNPSVTSSMISYMLNEISTLTEDTQTPAPTAGSCSSAAGSAPEKPSSRRLLLEMMAGIGVFPGEEKKAGDDEESIGSEFQIMEEHDLNVSPTGLDKVKKTPWESAQKVTAAWRAKGNMEKEDWRILTITRVYGKACGESPFVKWLDQQVQNRLKYVQDNLTHLWEAAFTKAEKDVGHWEKTDLPQAVKRRLERWHASLVKLEEELAEHKLVRLFHSLNQKNKTSIENALCLITRHPHPHVDTPVSRDVIKNILRGHNTPGYYFRTVPPVNIEGDRTHPQASSRLEALFMVLLATHAELVSTDQSEEALQQTFGENFNEENVAFLDASLALEKETDEEESIEDLVEAIFGKGFLQERSAFIEPIAATRSSQMIPWLSNIKNPFITRKGEFLLVHNGHVPEEGWLAHPPFSKPFGAGPLTSAGFVGWAAGAPHSFGTKDLAREANAYNFKIGRFKKFKNNGAVKQLWKKSQESDTEASQAPVPKPSKRAEAAQAIFHYVVSDDLRLIKPGDVFLRRRYLDLKSAKEKDLRYLDGVEGDMGVILGLMPGPTPQGLTSQVVVLGSYSAGDPNVLAGDVDDPYRLGGVNGLVVRVFDLENPKKYPDGSFDVYNVITLNIDEKKRDSYFPKEVSAEPSVPATPPGAAAAESPVSEAKAGASSETPSEEKEKIRRF